MHKFGPVTGQRGMQVPGWHADPEAGVAGHRQGRQPHHRARERAVPARCAAARRGRHDERLVTAPDEMLGHPQHAMRDTVHIGWEGLGDNRYSHAHNVNHEMPYQDMP